MSDLDPFAARGSGPPAAKFTNPGDSVEGTILRYEARQDVDQATGKPKTFDDGAPRSVVILFLRTDAGEEVRDFVKGRSVTQLKHKVWAVEGDGISPQPGARYKRTYTGLRGGKGPEKEYEIIYSNSQDTRELV